MIERHLLLKGLPTQTLVSHTHFLNFGLPHPSFKLWEGKAVWRPFPVPPLFDTSIASLAAEIMEEWAGHAGSESLPQGCEHKWGNLCARGVRRRLRLGFGLQARHCDRWVPLKNKALILISPIHTHYLFVAGRWSYDVPLRIPRSGFAAGVVRGRILVMGGHNGLECCECCSHTSCSIRISSADSSHSGCAESMNSRLGRIEFVSRFILHVACQRQKGNLLREVTSLLMESPAVGSCESLDPREGKWRPEPELLYHRCARPPVSVEDALVFVFHPSTFASRLELGTRGSVSRQCRKALLQVSRASYLVSGVLRHCSGCLEQHTTNASSMLSLFRLQGISWELLLWRLCVCCGGELWQGDAQHGGALRREEECLA